MSVLSKQDEAKVKTMYCKGMWMKAIAKVMGCGPKTVRDILTKAGIKIRLHGTLAPYTPTPKEIEQATADIRKGWGVTDHEDRAVGKAHAPVEFPTAKDSDLGHG